MEDLFNFKIDTAKLKLQYMLDPKQEVRRIKISDTKRDEVWRTYISDQLDGKCFCCKINNISYKNFECGHVISDKNRGKVELRNLRPVCKQCNGKMGSKDMYKFILEYDYWK